MDADFGNLQLYDPGERFAEDRGAPGLEPTFLDYFTAVEEGTGTCGAVLKRRERVIIGDVLTDPGFQPQLEIVTAAGYRAVQSTPLFSRAGNILGMISTHFRQPHRPQERDLCVLDLYAMQAAAIIECRLAEAALRASEDRFRRCFELGLIGMAVTSPVKGILEVNDELCRILGYERSELLQRAWAGVDTSGRSRRRSRSIRPRHRPATSMVTPWTSGGSARTAGRRQHHGRTMPAPR